MRALTGARGDTLLIFLVLVYGEIKELREEANALDRQKTVIGKVPTWPWELGAIVSFVSAL